MVRFMLFPSAQVRDPGVEARLAADRGELGQIAAYWFNFMRSLGNDVRELLHDGAPTACVGDAAFAYVNVFKGHTSIGFLLGTELPNPGNLLEGSGKFMRHVKLSPGLIKDEVALTDLVKSAYEGMKALLETKAGYEKGNG